MDLQEDVMATRQLSMVGFEQPSQMTVHRSGNGVLANLMRDTGVTVLVMLSEKYGLRRIPGLGKEQLIERILRNLPEDSHKRLEEELISARFGQASIDDLLDMLFEDEGNRKAAKPRLEDMSPSDATLIESGSRRWVYTMRGHDVRVDLNERVLGCDCAFFTFSAKRQMPCKHIITALRLVPQVYARDVLIDLVVARRFGGGDGWDFESGRAA
jgi:hypothetical protein